MRKEVLITTTDPIHSVCLGDWISDYQGRMGKVIVIDYDEQLQDFILTVMTSYGIDIDLIGKNITFVEPCRDYYTN